MLMSSETTQLPEYESPPVIEVAISLQFRPLEAIRSSHFGILWTELRNEGFSLTEDHAELAPISEELEGTDLNPQIGVVVQAYNDAPPLPRVWFLNAAQNELIQVQRDRIVVNWRKGASEKPYPRYKYIIRKFSNFLDRFSHFCSAERIGEIFPSHCEITYVNHIEPCTVWKTHADVDRVIAIWGRRYSDSYLGPVEDAAFRARYIMRSPTNARAGRLYVTFHPAYRAADAAPIFVLNMNARGRPASSSRKDVFELFDAEHEWIVRGFTSLTTPEMQQEIWRRKDG